MVQPVASTEEAPVRRRPQCPDVRRSSPHARNPVVPRARIVPVARRPDIVRRGSLRLLVHGQRRRRLIRLLDRIVPGLLRRIVVVIALLVRVVRRLLIHRLLRIRLAALHRLVALLLPKHARRPRSRNRSRRHGSRIRIHRRKVRRRRVRPAVVIDDRRRRIRRCALATLETRHRRKRDRAQQNLSQPCHCTLSEPFRPGRQPRTIYL